MTNPSTGDAGLPEEVVRSIAERFGEWNCSYGDGDHVSDIYGFADAIIAAWNTRAQSPALPEAVAWLIDEGGAAWATVDHADASRFEGREGYVVQALGVLAAPLREAVSDAIDAWLRTSDCAKNSLVDAILAALSPRPEGECLGSSSPKSEDTHRVAETGVVGLRECPQCDADAAALVGSAVQCEACGLIGPTGRDADAAITKWNGPTADVIGFRARMRDAPDGQDENTAQAPKAPDNQAGDRQVGSQGEERAHGLDAHAQNQEPNGQVATTASSVVTEPHSGGVDQAPSQQEQG